MTEKKLYALTDAEAETLRALARESATTVSNYALDALTPVTVDELGDEAVERMARVFADLDPGEPWPSNHDLGGGPCGTRDDEFRDAMRERAREVLAAALGTGEEA